jgi:thiol-disulfide isomerase/thioredoxin
VNNVNVQAIQKASADNGNIADHTEGTDTKVTLIEYGDYQCPGCDSAAPVMKQLVEKYKDKFNDNFIFELDFSSNKTIYCADLVITDWSGIGMEYSLSTAKPTLYINTKIWYFSNLNLLLMSKNFFVLAEGFEPPYTNYPINACV